MAYLSGVIEDPYELKRIIDQALTLYMESYINQQANTNKIIEGLEEENKLLRGIING